MGGSDPTQDPRFQLREALEEIRRALYNLRESVVQAVMRRNYLQDEAAKLERQVADLERKAALAEQINNTALAAEIRQERKSREAELERLQTLLAKAEAEAESAKLQLPEEEARLTQQARDLNTRFIQLAGGRIDANASGGFGTEADAMFERASEKMRNLEREASARGEVAGVSSSGTSTGPAYAPRPLSPSPEQSAEEMLTALEAKLGIAPQQAPASEPSKSNFLELDNKPPAAPATPASAPATESKAAPAQAASPQETTDASAAAAPQNTGASAASTPEVTTPTAASGSQDLHSASPAGGQEARAAQKTFSILPTAKGGTPRMEPTQRVRVAGIGTGNIFRGAHLPAYPEIPQVQLVALCDPDKEAQNRAYKRYQSLIEAKIKQAQERSDSDTIDRLQRDLETVQICDDISEVIETVKPDLVDICTQPFLHAPLAIRALEAGIHVMCEKPMARSWLETQRVIETVRRTGKFYQHNENWLWDKDYYTAKKLIEAGAIGEPILMFLATAHGGPEGSPKFWNPDFGGGGALLDNGIHAIGAAWYLSGLEKRPTLVKAAQPFGMSIRMPTRIIDGRFQQVTVDDDAHILIRFEDPNNGAWSTAHVEGSWSHRDSPDTVLMGTTGAIKFVSEGSQNCTAITTDAQGNVTSKTFAVSEGSRRYAVVTDAYGNEARRIETSGPTWQPWLSSFYGEILNMAECVRNGVPSISGPEFGADCSAVVGASYLSEMNGRRGCSVDEFKAFAKEIASRYPNDAKAADDALVEALLSAVRKKK